MGYQYEGNTNKYQYETDSRYNPPDLGVFEKWSRITTDEFGMDSPEMDEFYRLTNEGWTPASTYWYIEDKAARAYAASVGVTNFNGL